MPAMPRASNKAREVAYQILGVPGCLESSESSTHKKPKEKKHQGKFNIDFNNGDSQKP